MQVIRSFSIKKANLKASSNSADDASPTLWQCAGAFNNIISEEPLEIWLKQQHAVAATSAPEHSSEKFTAHTERLMTTMRSPGDDINLVRGWLHTRGLLTDAGRFHKEL
ncbi:MAG: formate dehydrogenase assembly factor FdhD [Paraglaciecola sp.]